MKVQSYDIYITVTLIRSRTIIDHVFEVELVT